MQVIIGFICLIGFDFITFCFGAPNRCSFAPYIMDDLSLNSPAMTIIFIGTLNIPGMTISSYNASRIRRIPEDNLRWVGEACPDDAPNDLRGGKND